MTFGTISTICQWRVARHACAVLLGMGALGIGASAPARAQDARTILVLDVSGSMNEQVGGRTKIEIAKETVQKLIAGWPDGGTLGLVAYGHRRPKDCADIQLVVPPGKVDKARLASVVAGLTPLGQTPLTQSVRMAADRLAEGGPGGTVILVSDGAETCGADPCATAADIAASGAKVVVHTVGFDIRDPKAKTQLQCLAQATGGKALLAKDAGELTVALAETAQVTMETAPAPPPPAPPPPTGPRKFTLRYVLTQGGAQVTQTAGISLITRVFAAGPDGGPAGRELCLSQAYEPDCDLAPGNYILEVIFNTFYGAMRLPLTIAPGQSNKLELVLDAGVLAVTGEPFRGNRLVRVFRTRRENDAFGARDVIIDYLWHTGPVKTVVPVGSYRITVAGAQGEPLSVDQDITIEAGKLLDIKVEK